ncbi:MAG: DUF502 domain-containing protein [Sedimentisphaerales bacterium]|nr:DUF502 domain-containing protein [Sedimentisphaerales bacterium]
MVKKSDKKFWLDFRRFFLRGLATLLPTVLTIVLLVKCYEFIQENISVHLTEGVIHIVLLVTDDYPSPADEDYKEYKAEYKLEKIDKTNPAEVEDVRLWMLRQKWKHGPWSVIGFILAIILVYIVGRLLASFIGRKVWQLFEGTVQQIPGFKQVYPYIKQVTDYLFGENKVEFSRVVAVPYPRKGLWSLGLVTGAGFRSMHETADEEFLTVFIPSSPTPITGYVIHVKKDEVIDVPITIEEALRFTVSGGVIVPGHEVLPTQRIELKSASLTDRIKTTDNEKEE